MKNPKYLYPKDVLKVRCNKCNHEFSITLEKALKIKGSICPKCKK